MIKLHFDAYEPDAYHDDIVAELEAIMLFPGDERKQGFRRARTRRDEVLMKAEVHNLDLPDLSSADRLAIQLGADKSASRDSVATEEAYERGYLIASMVWYLLAAQQTNKRNVRLSTLPYWSAWLVMHRASLAQSLPTLKPKLIKSTPPKKSRLSGPRAKPLTTPIPDWLKRSVRQPLFSGRTLLEIRKTHISVAHLWAAALQLDGSSTGMLTDRYLLPTMLSRAERYKQAMGANDLYSVVVKGFDASQAALVTIDLDPPASSVPHVTTDYSDLPVAVISEQFIESAVTAHNARLSALATQRKQKVSS